MRRILHFCSAVMLLMLPALAAQDVRAALRYTVRPGDTLLWIALRYDTTPDAIRFANQLRNPNLIYAGQHLIIPYPADVVKLSVSDARTPQPTAISATTSEIMHTVSPGETLGRIARAYGITTADLLAANPIPNPNRILPGDVLIIPQVEAPVEVADAAPIAVTSMGVPIIDAETAQSLRDIYARGLALGNDPRAFSKVGDCNSENPFFLFHFDDGKYTLGAYSGLQPAIDHFSGSFGRQSMAVWTGNHSWSVIDPIWSDPAHCAPGESPLACEIRLHRPSFLLVRLGTNDAGAAKLFTKSMRHIIEYSLQHGVIPIIGTKPDYREGPGDDNNRIMHDLAAEYHVPLWDFAAVARTLPNNGLDGDGVHMRWRGLDFTNPAIFQHGHTLHNLSALMSLDAVWHAVSGP